MNFYILKNRDFRAENGFADTEFIRGTKTKLSNDAPTCPKCGQYIGGRKWIPPYYIELEMYTRQFGNVVLGTGGDKLVVDDCFKSRFEKVNLTGLEFLGKAEISKIICRGGVKKKQLSEPPLYYIARIQYGSAAIDHEKSGSIFDTGMAPTCQHCRLGIIRRYSRIVIDESTWNGTDIFLARGIGAAITTTQRFKDWWDSCNFNNCKIIPSEDDHCDFDAPFRFGKLIDDCD